MMRSGVAQNVSPLGAKAGGCMRGLSADQHGSATRLANPGLRAVCRRARPGLLWAAAKG
jgi:hypothetical protein